MDLPDGVTVGWDRTLENRRIDLTVRIQDPADWDDAKRWMNRTDMKQKIQKILNEL